MACVASLFLLSSGVAHALSSQESSALNVQSAKRCQYRLANEDKLVFDIPVSTSSTAPTTFKWAAGFAKFADDRAFVSIRTPTQFVEGVPAIVEVGASYRMVKKSSLRELRRCARVDDWGIWTPRPSRPVRARTFKLNVGVFTQTFSRWGSESRERGEVLMEEQRIGQLSETLRNVGARPVMRSFTVVPKCTGIPAPTVEMTPTARAIDLIAAGGCSTVRFGFDFRVRTQDRIRGRWTNNSGNWGDSTLGFRYPAKDAYGNDGFPIDGLAK